MKRKRTILRQERFNSLFIVIAARVIISPLPGQPQLEYSYSPCVEGRPLTTLIVCLKAERQCSNS
jgi:hypothetical protein